MVPDLERGWVARVGRGVRARPARFVLGAVLALGVAATVMAPDLSAQTALDTDLGVIFSRKKGQWLANAQGALIGLFGALLILEFMASSVKWQKDRVGPHEILLSIFWKIGLAFIMLFLFRYPENTTDRVIHSFGRLGGMVAGESSRAMTPTEVMTQGSEIAASLWSQLAVERGMPLEPPTEQGLFTRWSAWLNGVYNSLGIGLVNGLFSMFFCGAVILIVCVVVLIAYGIVALQLLLVQLEATIILSTGVVFLPFGTFRLTAGLAEAYLKYVLEVAVRFFFLQLIAGVGYDLFDSLYAIGKGLLKYDATRGEMHWVLNPPFLDWQVAVALSFTAVAFAYLAWKIPGLFGRRMTADTRIGLSDALRGT